jgi:carbamoyl-phosphate synthase large subunit
MMAWQVVDNQADLQHELDHSLDGLVATTVLTNAKEFEVDGIAERGRVLAWAICEHLEQAGVHSGGIPIVMFEFGKATL